MFNANDTVSAGVVIERTIARNIVSVQGIMSFLELCWF